ncbi:MAG TPA: hypothetical protein VKY27_05345 [Bacteriovoracaceae bacterium]|nr:hypothetical protein [Bacteriovoracaceae bacterium]
MKFSFIFVLIFAITVGAYYSAKDKMSAVPDLRALHLGMSKDELKIAFGAPVHKHLNQLTYLFADSAQLIITLRDQEVASAQLKFHRPLKISDPQIKQLNLVQMEFKNNDRDLSWFFAGDPEEGLIYKITTNGVIESITWVPPFSYQGEAPKRVGTLLRDFQDKTL